MTEVKCPTGFEHLFFGSLRCSVLMDQEGFLSAKFKVFFFVVFPCVLLYSDACVEAILS